MPEWKYVVKLLAVGFISCSMASNTRLFVHLRMLIWGIG